MAIMGEKKKKKRKNVNAVEPYSDEEWRARGDAEALARAEAVKCDTERMAAAKAWAARELEKNKAAQAEAQKLVELGTS
jgi:hypothetical protein